MKSKRLSSAEINQPVEGWEERQLLTWYNRWKDNVAGYVLYTMAIKLPVYFLIWLLISFSTAKQFFAAPIPFLVESWPKVVAALVILAWVFWMDWRIKARKYYFLSASIPALSPPAAGHRIDRIGKAAEKRIPRKWEKWGKRKWLLASTFSIGITGFFMGSLYLLNGFTENEWEGEAFMRVFEGNTFYLVSGTFLLLGFYLGYGIWKELKENHCLITQIKSPHGIH